MSSCPDTCDARGPGRRVGPLTRTATPALARRVAERPDWREDGLVHRSSKSEGGFTLVEVLVSTLVLTIGLIGIGGLLVVTTQAQIGARESARSVRLAQTKMDEIMKLPFAEPRLSIGGSLDANVANHNDSPVDGITVRWAGAAGPTDDTRVITVRVIYMRAQHYRQTELSSIVREW